MISKTYRVYPLPPNTGRLQIQLALSHFNPSKIHLSQNQAFLQLQSSPNLNPQFPHLPIPMLPNAKMEDLGAQFNWSEFNSSESSVQELVNEDDDESSESVQQLVEDEENQKLEESGGMLNLVQDWVEPTRCQNEGMAKDQSHTDRDLPKCLHQTPKFGKLTSIQGTCESGKSEEINLQALFSEQTPKNQQYEPSLTPSLIGEVQRQKTAANIQRAIVQEEPQNNREEIPKILRADKCMEKEKGLEQTGNDKARHRQREERLRKQEQEERMKTLLEVGRQVRKQGRISLVINVLWVGILVIWGLFVAFVM